MTHDKFDLNSNSNSFSVLAMEACMNVELIDYILYIFVVFVHVHTFIRQNVFSVPFRIEHLSLWSSEIEKMINCLAFECEKNCCETQLVAHRRDANLNGEPMNNYLSNFMWKRTNNSSHHTCVSI